MKVLFSNSTNIFKNLSLERLLYRQKQLNEPILLFYRNDRSIIIGRNQNPWKECKIEKIFESKTNLCRRFSGGGAVYQDLGNLCFSFIKPVQSGKAPFDEKEVNNQILVKAFKKLGLDVEAQGRNDLTINGIVSIWKIYFNDC
jgi:lipoate-protein ligase A